jgi:DNA-binding XRE family transcriptional regulator
LPSIVFVVAKPIVGMPKELITLGDHIKKKRLENIQTQKDVGKIIGTDNFTIVNWERNSTKNIPAKYYPKIMEFLNYCPLTETKNMPNTFSKKIKLHRLHQGLNQKQFSQLLKVDSTTVKFWESGERNPSEKIVDRLDKINYFACPYGLNSPDIKLTVCILIS